MLPVVDTLTEPDTVIGHARSERAAKALFNDHYWNNRGFRFLGEVYRCDHRMPDGSVTDCWLSLIV